MAELKKNRIIFVTPPYHCGVVEVAGSWPPLGFLYLAQQAIEAGWHAEIYDAMTLKHDFKAIEAELKKREFDILATTAITPTFPDALELCFLAKRINANCLTLMGGVHPSFCFTEIFGQKNNPVDYIIRGEAETPLCQFLTNYDNRDERHKTPNIIYKDNGKISVNRKLPLARDLDGFKAAWHLLDWDIYKYYVIPESRLGAISTSRGCNHGCTFCSQQKFWDKIWRGRRPEIVLNEMEFLNSTFGINVFLFTDEYPTYDRDRWEKLLDLIIQSRLDIYILMETRVADIIRDEDILNKYRKAGVIHIYVGAEATDQEKLDKINKEIDVNDSQKALELIVKHGMITETSFVLGFPEETPDSIENTFQLSKQFNPDFAHYLAITPWPYSDLYEEVREYIETDDYRLYNLIEPIIKPEEMTRDDVDLAIINCYRRFYMSKMTEFMKEPDPFRRHYLLTSTRLIMKSSFLIKKFARLGLNQAKMMKGVLK